jgi:N utilization substance protein A
MKSEFLLAFNEIAETRKLPKEVILEAIQTALVSAYRRSTNTSPGQIVEARFSELTGDPTIWIEKEVVEQVQNEHTEIALEEALEHDPEAALGEMVMVENTPADFGRIAAQTAKQIILQRMREAERDAQFQEYQERLGDLVTGTVQSVLPGSVTIGLGRTEAILPRSQQMPGERYKPHDKVRAYVMEVRKTNRGPQIVVSRAHRNMLKRLLEYEVPEIYGGTVEIKSIAREPGARSKVAVAATQDGIDPVGACVGMRGIRIQNIVNELNNEKIDVIEWNPDQASFIAKALSPARVKHVFLDDDPISGRTATVIVPDDQLSLAIGREGQNARLAAKLTGWRIDIKSISEGAQEEYERIHTPEYADLLEEHTEIADRIAAIMEKKAANRTVMPEEYDRMAEFITIVQLRTLEMREAERAEYHAARARAREQINPLAYEFSLERTDLPLSVYEKLTEAGYETVGQVMEQLLVNEEFFFNISDFDQEALNHVIEMAATIEIPETIDEEEGEEAALMAEAAEAGEGAEAIPEQMAEGAAEGAALEGEPAPEGSPPQADEKERARAERAALVERMRLMELEEQGELAQETPEPVVSEAAEGEPGKYADLDEHDLVEMSEESEEEYEEARRARAKARRRQLVYDEDLNKVVAKRRRKPGRTQDWGDDLEESLR